VSLPTTSRYVVVGAGIHGLSTAYHLAKELRTRGVGSGADIVVPILDIDEFVSEMKGRLRGSGS